MRKFIRGFAGMPAIDSPDAAVASVRWLTSTRSSAARRSSCSATVRLTILWIWRRAAARLVHPDAVRVCRVLQRLPLPAAAAGAAAGSAMEIATAIATPDRRSHQPKPIPDCPCGSHSRLPL
jgi:hypothetical protein